MLQLASWRLNRIKNLFVSDDDGLDKRFSIGEQRSLRGQYFICPSRRMKLENLFDDLAFLCIWATSLKFTFTFLKSLMKLGKIYNGPRAFVRFENGPRDNIS